MLEDPVDGHLVTLDDVEDTRRQACIGEHLGDEQGDRRVLLAGLEHEGVAGGDRVGEHPHGHHGGEVEGRNACHDTEWLAQGVDVDAGGHLLAVGALEHLGDATGELDVLEPAGEFAGGVGGHFAVLLGDEVGDLVATRVHDLAEGEEDVGALGQRRRAPRGEGLLGHGDGGVHLGDTGESHRALLLAGGGVEDRAGAAGRPGHALSVDPVVDRVHVLLRSSS